MNNKTHTMLLGLALSFGLASGTAVAQEAASSNGWFKACNDQGDTKICNVQYQAVASTGQVITSVNLAEITGPNPRRIFQITVPTDRLIPPGINMKIDDKKPTAIPFAFCTQRICAAEVALDDNLVNVLKSGAEMVVTSVNFQGKQNPIKVLLEGFGSAYDGAPITQEDLAARQQKLAEELQKKAEAAQDELQKALDAAKEQGAQ